MKWLFVLFLTVIHAQVQADCLAALKDQMNIDGLIASESNQWSAVDQKTGLKRDLNYEQIQIEKKNFHVCTMTIQIAPERYSYSTALFFEDWKPALHVSEGPLKLEGNVVNFGEYKYYFCSKLDVFNSKGCPGDSITQGFLKKTGKEKKFIDFIRNGNLEALLFARKKSVFLLLKTNPKTKKIQEISILGLKYNDSGTESTSLPMLEEILSLDKKQREFLLNTSTGFYEEGAEEIFYIKTEPKVQVISLLEGNNVSAHVQMERKKTFEIQVTLINGGYSPALRIGKSVTVQDKNCKGLLQQVVNFENPGELASETGTARKNEINFHFENKNKIKLLRCEAPTKTPGPEQSK